MLRRKPTAITLTTEDIAIYEDKRAREAAAEQARQQQQQFIAENRDPHAHAHGLSHDALRARVGAGGDKQVRSREERLGLGGRN